ncbi:MAG: DUF1707 domain-containing protein [Gaiellales bacterium]
MAEKPATYDRRRPRDRTLRVGDEERDAVAELLREHHVAGRLQGEEFQDRLDRCISARTHADLDDLMADLPGAAGPARRERRPWTPWPLALVPLAVIAAIVLSGGRAAWLAVPLVLFFVVRPLVWRGVTGRRGFGGWGCGVGYRQAG